MGGLLLIGMLILFFSKLWPFLVAAAITAALWFFVIAPARERAAFERLDRLRHERARREIDDIAFQASRAMVRAASQSPAVVVEAEVIDE